MKTRKNHPVKMGEIKIIELTQQDKYQLLNMADTSESSISIIFDLEINGVLVTLSPNENNNHYSYRMNFTDYSTLQYLPAEQIALAYYKHQKIKSFFGVGNGWEIIRSINTYLLVFFNTYLKGENNVSFKKCDPLAKNTILKCGMKTQQVK